MFPFVIFFIFQFNHLFFLEKIKVIKNTFNILGGSYVYKCIGFSFLKVFIGFIISFVLALLCCILLFWALENYNLYFRETVYSAELENENKLLNERIVELESNNGTSSKTKSSVEYYYTPNGECYHKSNCSYLDNSSDVRQQSVDILEEMGYRKCSRCF